MTTITVSPEAQAILGIPATIDSRDARLMPGPGVFVYFLDEAGNVVTPGVDDRPIVAVTASSILGVSRRAHWGSSNGGGMGHTAGS